MRKILSSTNCCTSDIDILCPSLLKEELEEIVQFLYIGQVSYENETNIIDDLTQLFGYPDHMDLDIQTEANYVCWHLSVFFLLKVYLVSLLESA